MKTVGSTLTLCCAIFMIAAAIFNLTQGGHDVVALSGIAMILASLSRLESRE